MAVINWLKACFTLLQQKTKNNNNKSGQWKKANISMQYMYKEIKIKLLKDEKISAEA